MPFLQIKNRHINYKFCFLTEKWSLSVQCEKTMSHIIHIVLNSCGSTSMKLLTYFPKKILKSIKGNYFSPPKLTTEWYTVLMSFALIHVALPTTHMYKHYHITSHCVEVRHQSWFIFTSGETRRLGFWKTWTLVLQSNLYLFGQLKIQTLVF